MEKFILFLLVFGVMLLALVWGQFMTVCFVQPIAFIFAAIGGYLIGHFGSKFIFKIVL